jgi:hypothetical protein
MMIISSFRSKIRMAFRILKWGEKDYMNNHQLNKNTSEDGIDPQKKISTKKIIAIVLIVLFLFIATPFLLELINFLVSPLQRELGTDYSPMVRVTGFLVGCYFFFELILENLNSGPKK